MNGHRQLRGLRIRDAHSVPLVVDPTAENFKAACAALGEFAKFCDTHDAIETARTFGADDAEMARRYAATIQQWLDAFAANVYGASL